MPAFGVGLACSWESQCAIPARCAGSCTRVTVVCDFFFFFLTFYLVGLPSLLGIQAGFLLLHLRPQQRLVPPVEVERFQCLAARLFVVFV